LSELSGVDASFIGVDIGGIEREKWQWWWVMMINGMMISFLDD
jgi:hypothetical protein